MTKVFKKDERRGKNNEEKEKEKKSCQNIDLMKGVWSLAKLTLAELCRERKKKICMKKKNLLEQKEKKKRKEKKKSASLILVYKSPHVNLAKENFLKHLMELYIDLS